jgi:hypothetical protein
MKILYVINGYNDGGAELGLLDLVENGFFAGHDLILYALARKRGRVRDRLLALLGPDRVRWLSDAPCLSDLALPKATAQLARVFNAHQPDVIILSLPQANLTGRIASIIVPRATVVSFEHNMNYKRKVAHRLMAVTAPLVDAVFYDHPDTWRSVRAVFPRLPDAAAHYVPLTVVKPLAAPASIPTGRRHCVTTMRLDRLKNHIELFHAIRILVDRGYELMLTVAGEGFMRPQLERLADELQLGEQVRLVGFVEKPDELLRQCDTYILSSTNEGLSRSVVEAMAAGLLVVSTDVGGIREYGVHGENMIKSAGPGRHELAAAIGAALDLGQDARRLQEGALRTVEQEFSPPVVQQHWKAALGAIENARRMRARSSSMSSSIK